MAMQFRDFFLAFLNHFVESIAACVNSFSKEFKFAFVALFFQDGHWIDK